MIDDADFIAKLRQMQRGDNLVFQSALITDLREGAVFMGHRGLFQQQIFLGKKRASHKDPWVIAIEYV